MEMTHIVRGGGKGGAGGGAGGDIAFVIMAHYVH